MYRNEVGRVLRLGDLEDEDGKSYKKTKERRRMVLQR